jgi:hypothetical protein
MPALRNSVQLEHRLKQEGLGVMLVGEGGTAGEGGGASPSSCGILQLVGVLGWDRCVGQLQQRGGDGRSCDHAGLYQCPGCEPETRYGVLATVSTH